MTDGALPLAGARGRLGSSDRGQPDTAEVFDEFERMLASLRFC